MHYGLVPDMFPGPHKERGISRFLICVGPLKICVSWEVSVKVVPKRLEAKLAARQFLKFIEIEQRPKIECPVEDNESTVQRIPSILGVPT
jgi:hypothetical protein